VTRPSPPRPISLDAARRLAVAKQHLDGAAKPSLLDLIRGLGCLQLDPTNVVARNHLLVLRSRLGRFDVGELERLRWEERALFDYWAHAASIVLTEDFPLHRYLMRSYDTGTHDWMSRGAAWMRENDALRRHILRELRRRGPLRGRDFEDVAEKQWRSTGWTGGQTVTRMLEFLWQRGKVLVARREGQTRLWDLPERVLPPEVLEQRAPSPLELTRRTVPRSLRALGIATDRHIGNHFVPGRFPELARVLDELVRRGTVVTVAPEGLGGRWFVHADDLPLLERVEAGEWQPRTTLLSPFDNLIRDRKRNAVLWDFGDYKLEIYTPVAKRQWGYFAMPILHGERLVGTVDSAVDRDRRVLRVHKVVAAPGVPAGADVAAAVRELASFAGADEVAYGEVPKLWRRELR
jgi:uncharacterized protein YcaQ